ncbi:Hypothetical predicted protein [Mytilus galloprovincialis]|uniref:Major facilitator superfamily (MFS) profile domain-containing protein n=1 Tax=Mytilus galloprovincialis TaxID=29158 RepID=A0A8B6FJ29_MYTGA|nr:Hypothetical predicted protein [Mytilus galloprovincialis]
MFSFFAFFILTLGNKYFSSRQLIMVGGFVAALGYLLNAFAPTVTFLIFSQGILHASGCAASYGPAIVLLSTYFDKRKGLANSLANAGGSIGGLCIPLLIRHLLDTYGLQGALMIMSGILFHITAAGALMRPFLMNTNTKTNDKQIKIVLIQDKETSKTANGSSPNEKGEHESSKMFVQLEPQVSVQSERSLGSHHSIVLDKLSGSALNLYGSMGSIANAITVVSFAKSNPSVHSSISEVDKSKCSCCSNLFNCSILRNHSFQLLMVTGLLCVFGSALTITFIPPFAKDYNIPDDKIALLVTISAVCDFIGRFAIAWIADSGFLRRNHLVGVCIFISGVAAMLNPFYTDFPSFAAYAATYGLVGGVYFSLYPLLIVDAVGQENLSDGLAIQFQVHGVSFMVNSFLIGYLRDITGSYHGSFFLIGIGLLIGTVCLFCEPIARKLEEKRTKTKLTG